MRWSSSERKGVGLLAVLAVIWLGKQHADRRGHATSIVDSQQTSDATDATDAPEVRNERAAEYEKEVHLVAAAQHPDDPISQMVDVVVVRGYGKPRAAGHTPKVRC